MCIKYLNNTSAKAVIGVDHLLHTRRSLLSGKVEAGVTAPTDLLTTNALMQAYYTTRKVSILFLDYPAKYLGLIILRVAFLASTQRIQRIGEICLQQIDITI
uniref:Uncharacterized protein n=1 Tax=Glossina pallidipes TaxID=7398 RepID=A0A1B0AEZ2_GLOPL